MEKVTAVRAFDVSVSGDGGSTILAKGRLAFELGDIEGLIWSMCDGQHTVGEIAERIRRQFAVDYQVAVADTHEFLRELADADLVDLVAPPQ